MQTKITANTKKLVRKRQHIKSLMSDLYKETSPNSKILKYLLQNPHSLPKPQNLLPSRSLRKSNMMQPRRLSSTVLVEKDDILAISKDLTIEGPEIDDLYNRNSEKKKKQELKIRKMDNLLFETLQHKQMNPPSFAQSLKREMKRFAAKSLDVAAIKQAAEEQETIKKKLKTEKCFKGGKVNNSLEFSIRKRLEQKKEKTPNFINRSPRKSEFLTIYHELQRKHIEESPEKPSVDFGEGFEMSRGRSAEVLLSRAGTQSRKRLEMIEQRKAFERLLQSAKGRLIEKVNNFNQQKKIKAMTLHANMTTIDKIKKKYEFFAPKVKKPEEEVAEILENMRKNPKKLEQNKEKETTHNGKSLFSMTFNEKVRKILVRNSTVSETGNKKNMMFLRECDDLMRIREKNREARYPFAETYQNFKKMYSKEKKSRGLLREMKVGFEEIEKTLKGFKSQLNDVPESLTIDLKD